LNNFKEILLGDNPFFGIDNLSQERARKRMSRLNDFDKITDLMDFVYALGVKGFVVSTHPQLKNLIIHMEKNTTLLKKFDFYPILPYAQGYVTKATEKGILNGMIDILSSGTIKSKLKIVLQGSFGFLMKDINKLLDTFIDIELMNLHKVRKKIIFLHDGITDLALGLGMKNVFEIFQEHIKDHYGVEAGFVTKNFPRLSKSFENWNISSPYIMTSFNPIGYQMNPTKTECEKYIKNRKIIAMNVLAAGYLTPQKSFQYISKLDINSVVIVLFL